MKRIFIIILISLFPIFSSFAQMDIESANELSPNISFSYEIDGGLNNIFFGLDYHRYVSDYVGFGINPLVVVSDDYYAGFVGPIFLFLFTEADKTVKPFLGLSAGVGFDAPKIAGKSDTSFATGTNAMLGIKANLSEHVMLNGGLAFTGIFSNDSDHPFKGFVMNTLSLSFLF